MQKSTIYWYPQWILFPSDFWRIANIQLPECCWGGCHSGTTAHAARSNGDTDTFGHKNINRFTLCHHIPKFLSARSKEAERFSSRCKRVPFRGPILPAVFAPQHRNMTHRLHRLITNCKLLSTNTVHSWMHLGQWPMRNLRTSLFSCWVCSTTVASSSTAESVHPDILAGLKWKEFSLICISKS